jgi:hypothetical protein
VLLHFQQPSTTLSGEINTGTSDTINLSLPDFYDSVAGYSTRPQLNTTKK